MTQREADLELVRAVGLQTLFTINFSRTIEQLDGLTPELESLNRDLQLPLLDHSLSFQEFRSDPAFDWLSPEADLWMETAMDNGFCRW